MLYSVRQTITLAIMSICFAMMGCSDGGSSKPALTQATVTVLINGQPLPHALVTLTPTDKQYSGDATSSAETDDAGVAKLMCGTQPGACLGINQVTVTEASPPEEVRSQDSDEGQRAAMKLRAPHKNRPIPNNYASVAQSDLKIEIKKDANAYKVDLRR